MIAGDGRSGTTLLSVLLDSHPKLAIGPELHFRGPPNLGQYLLHCLKQRDLATAEDGWDRLKRDPELNAGINFINRCHRFGATPEDLRSLIEATVHGAHNRLTSFFERCALVERVARLVRDRAAAEEWGIKIMRDLRILNQYAAAWPGARFIHIIRDGRDVAASQVKDHSTWGYSDIRQAALGWKDLIERGRRWGRDYPVFELRYEDLVRDCRAVMARLLEYIGVPWDDSVLAHDQIGHTLFSNPYRHPSIDTVRKPVNSSAIGRYRRDLTSAEIATFEALAGDVLVQCGYTLHDSGRDL